jgi:hypothetical protein
MFRFARYAQHVSDIELQKLWARILASAAVGDRQRLSAAALQTMSLMDKRTAIDFENFCRVLVTLSRIYPLHENSYQAEPQDIDLKTLQELGLIEVASGKEYAFAEFNMAMKRNILDLHLSRLQLTQRGVEIAQALFSQRGRQMMLDDDLALRYLREAISTNVALYDCVQIFPKVNGQQVSYSIDIRKWQTQLPLGDESSPIVVEGVSSRLVALMDWLTENYTVARAPNPNVSQ